MSNTHEQRTLRFWHALEHLTPYDLKQAADQARTDIGAAYTIPYGAGDFDLSWLSPAKRKALKLNPNKSYRARLYFGVFQTVEAGKALRELFGGREPAVGNPVYEVNKQTCYGSFAISSGGRLLPATLELSTLPWAIGYLGGGDLDEKLSVPDWAELFHSYNQSVFSDLIEEAKIQERSCAPADAHVLEGLIKSILGRAGWLPVRFDSLAYCVLYEERTRTKRADGNLQDEEQNDAPILNSFFIPDLERVYHAAGPGDVGAALSAYLSESEPAHRIDLDDRSQLRPWLSPGHLPPGRWMSEDSHLQTLMQQAAVNIASENLRGKAGLFSVNGPPGTGKTTMLRDIIADVIVRRAEVMSQFSSPSGAFTPDGEIPVTGERVVTLYRPDPRLTGFEIVVASSNNGAVQNITQEIPAGKAVGKSYREEAAYFRKVAEYVINAPREENLPPWGMVAAVLGNSANRGEFAQRFWFDLPDEEHPARYCFLQHLREAAKERIDWHSARAEFIGAMEHARSILRQREAWATAVDQQEEMARRVRQAQHDLEVEQGKLNQAEEEERRAVAAYEQAARELQEIRADIEAVARSKPSWLTFVWARFFKNEAVATYTERMAASQRDLERARASVAKRKEQKEGAERSHKEQRESTAKAAELLQKSSESKRQNEWEIETGRRALGDAFADNAWWEQDNAKLQLRAPWVDEELNHARAKLFLAAVHLHQAFIKSATPVFRANIGLWINVLKGGLTGIDENQHHYLWQTFFLVVPVVSTTFASVARMFARMGRESIGWLLIDEAGQATPQSAVGALWRAKRAVVVGDPLQIEPVFTVEEAVVERVRRNYGVEAHWSPLVASAQTLADRANPYGAQVLNEDSALWVGCPLRVHRRCQRPMFDIANRIAYDNKMVFATPPLKDENLPPDRSRWILVEGDCESGHWVAEQGEHVLRLLRKATKVTGDLPDLFIISPFRDVARELSRLVVKRRNEWLPVGVPDSKLKRWANKSIGTVHTFQGKENPGVILVLGVDRRTIGAARWAAKRPNILNVATTRAQGRFYIIGDTGVWGDLKYFRVALAEIGVSRE